MAVAVVRRRPERWRSSGDRCLHTAARLAVFTVAVVVGAALGGAGWEEVVGLLLAGSLAIRLLAAMIANEVFINSLRRRPRWLPEGRRPASSR